MQSVLALRPVIGNRVNKQPVPECPWLIKDLHTTGDRRMRESRPVVLPYIEGRYDPWYDQIGSNLYIAVKNTAEELLITGVKEYTITELDIQSLCPSKQVPVCIGIPDIEAIPSGVE